MSEAVLTAPGPADVQPVANETRDRIATGLVTAVPLFALGFAAWQSWQGLLQPADLAIFTGLYVLTGLGVPDHRKHHAFSDKVGDPHSPHVSFVDGTFVVWAVGGLALPFLLGLAIGGSLAAGLTAVLWGGLVRLFVLHHLTYTFPTSAQHGMRKWALDPSALVIRGLEATGPAWDVVRVSPERQQAKLQA